MLKLYEGSEGRGPPTDFENYAKANSTQGKASGTREILDS